MMIVMAVIMVRTSQVASVWVLPVQPPRRFLSTINLHHSRISNILHQQPGIKNHKHWCLAVYKTNMMKECTWTVEWENAVIDLSTYLFHGDDAAAAIVGGGAAIVRAVISVRLLEGIAAPRISTQVIQQTTVPIIVGAVVIRWPRLIVSRHRVRARGRIPRRGVSREVIVALVLPQPSFLPFVFFCFVSKFGNGGEWILIRLIVFYNSLQSINPPTCMYVYLPVTTTMIYGQLGGMCRQPQYEVHKLTN